MKAAWGNVLTTIPSREIWQEFEEIWGFKTTVGCSTSSATFKTPTLHRSRGFADLPRMFSTSLMRQLFGQAIFIFYHVLVSLRSCLEHSSSPKSGTSPSPESSADFNQIFAPTDAMLDTILYCSAVVRT